MGHRQSLCPKPLVFELPMSYPLCLSLPRPSPHQPPMPHHSLSQPLVPVPVTQSPCPSPPYFRVLCASAICSFWKISGGRNGESFPPSSEQTRRCLGKGTGPPPRSCAAGFTWAFPGEGGRTGRPCLNTSLALRGHPAPHNGTPTPHSPSAAAMDLTLSRHCSASFSSFGVSGVTPSLFSVGRVR